MPPPERGMRSRTEGDDQIMQTEQSTISLSSSPVGRWLRIIALPVGTIRAQFIRLGFGEGEKIRCVERLPGGTIVIQKSRQQIAVGHQLSNQIMIAVMVEEEEVCA